MVFFKVIVNDADRGQYAWDEWIAEAMPENLMDYKLQDIRVRRTNPLDTWSISPHQEISFICYWLLLLLFCLLL